MLDALRQIVAGLAMACGVVLAWPLVMAAPAPFLWPLMWQIIGAAWMVFSVVLGLRWTIAGLFAGIAAITNRRTF